MRKRKPPCVKMGLIKIENDLYDIAARLKEIDCTYKVFFNTETRRFEVHSRFGLEVAAPFEKLDARTVSHVLKTRIQNREKIIAEIDAANEKAEIEARRKIMEKAADCIEEQLCK